MSPNKFISLIEECSVSVQEAHYFDRGCMDHISKFQLDQHLNKKSYYMLNVNIELYNMLSYKLTRRPFIVALPLHDNTK